MIKIDSVWVDQNSVRLVVPVHTDTCNIYFKNCEQYVFVKVSAEDAINALHA